MSEYKKVGKYSIVKKLGEGVYGKVYLAQENRMSEMIALKWTLKDDSPTRAELKVMNSVEPHPNVVRLHEHFTAPQAACLAYEFCEGGDLNGWLQRRGEVSLPQACDWALDLAGGVGAVHRAGFIHCDLKSDNVLLKFNGTLGRHQLKLIDFGLARQLRPDGRGSIRLVPEVETGPYYSSSPEIFNGSPVGEKSDIFALGLIYLAFFHPIVVDDGTFRLAAPYVTEDRYWGKSLREVPQSVINRIIAEHVPDAFLKLISSMLQLDPVKRPTIPEIIRQVQRIQEKVTKSRRSTNPLIRGLREITEKRGNSNIQCENSHLSSIVKKNSGMATVGVA